VLVWRGLAARAALAEWRGLAARAALAEWRALAEHLAAPVEWVAVEWRGPAEHLAVLAEWAAVEWQALAAKEAAAPCATTIRNATMVFRARLTSVWAAVA